MKRRIKTLLLAILILSLSLGLLACGEDKTKQDKTASSEASSEAVSKEEVSEKEQEIAEEAKELKGPEGEDVPPSYQEVVGNFTKMSLAEAKEAASKKDVYMYIGDEGCSFCVEFVPVLAEIQKKHNLEIIYVGIDEVDSPEFQAFMEELNFDSMPSLFTSKDGKFTRIKIEPPYEMEKIEKDLSLAE